MPLFESLGLGGRRDLVENEIQRADIWWAFLLVSLLRTSQIFQGMFYLGMVFECSMTCRTPFCCMRYTPFSRSPLVITISRSLLVIIFKYSERGGHVLLIRRVSDIGVVNPQGIFSTATRTAECF